MEVHIYSYQAQAVQMKQLIEKMKQLIEIADALQYSCGAPLIPKDHELSGVFVVRKDVSFADPVDKLY